ncbi:hypothetical protein N9D58_03350 [Planktomarina temperata]|nr:hypothetical protein [Planktomarina temperata]
MTIFNRVRNLSKNTLLQAFHQIIAIVGGLYITRFIIDFYGSSTNGLLITINQYLSYFTLVAAGIVGSAIYALYKPVALVQKEQIYNIMDSVKTDLHRSANYFLAFCIAFASLSLFTFSVQFNEISDLIILITLMAVPEYFKILCYSKYKIVLVVTKREYILSIFSILLIAGNIMCVELTRYFSGDVIFFRTLLMIAFLMNLLLLFRAMRSQFSMFQSEKSDYGLPMRREAMLCEILSGVHHGLPIAIGAFFLSFEQLSVLSVYLLLIHSVSSLVSTLSNSIVPHFGEMIVRNDNLFPSFYLQYEFVFFIFLCWAFSCTSFLFIPFIELYIGDTSRGIYVDYYLLIIVMLSGLSNLTKSCRGTLMQSNGLFKETRQQWVLQLSIAAISCITLSVFWNVYGLVIGMIISNIYRNIAIMGFTARYFTQISFRYNTRYLLVSCALPLLSFFAYVRFVSSSVGLLDFAILVIAGSFVLLLASTFSLWFVRRLKKI